MTDTLERAFSLIDHRDPILTTPADRINFGDGDPAVEHAQESERTLVAAMKDKNCLGLSATQIGVNAQAFAVNVTPAQCVFNPRVVDQSAEGEVLEEACLSFPGLVTKVWRPKAIKVRFQTSDGVVYTEKYAGMTARVFLHETDHLLGRVFFDSVGKMQLTMDVKRSAKRGYPYNVATLWQIAERSRKNRA